MGWQSGLEVRGEKEGRGGGLLRKSAFVSFFLYSTVSLLRDMKSINLNRRVLKLKPWPNGLASRYKLTQVCKTRTCVGTCDGRLNGFASPLVSSRKSGKVVNFTHVQLTCDQLVSTCIRWPNGEKLGPTRVRI